MHIVVSCCIHNISHFFLRKKNLVNNMCCSERFFSILFQGHLRTEYSHLVTESEEEKIHMAHAGRKRKNTERQLLPSIFLSSLRSSPQHQEHQISFGAYFEPSIMVVIGLYYLTPAPCPQSTVIKLILSSIS